MDDNFNIDPTGADKILHGANWHKWLAWQDGPDIKGSGLGTVFGGGNDPLDNSAGYWDNPIGPQTHGVSLPTGRIMGTRGSPFPPVPKGTLVKVYNRRTGKSMTVPVVDEGPVMTDEADKGPGHAMVDIAQATAKALGMDANSTDPVDIRILGGAQHLTPSQKFMAPADVTHVDPTDSPILAQIGQGMKLGANFDPIVKMAGQLKSGAVQDLLPQLAAHLDTAQNTAKVNPEESRRELRMAKSIYQRIMQRYRAMSASPMMGPPVQQSFLSQ